MAEIVDMPVRSYRDLKVWQSSKALAVEIYRLTSGLPKEEAYGLVAQMRRSAVSVPSNIAEGNARPTKEYVRFIGIAQGSLAELETQLEIACDIGYFEQSAMFPLLEQTTEIGRMLGGLEKSLASNL